MCVGKHPSVGVNTVCASSRGQSNETNEPGEVFNTSRVT